MGSFFVIAIFLAVGGIITGAILISNQLEKKRRERIGAAAQEMGLNFIPEGSEALRQRLQDFHLFTLGRDRKMKNLIQGDSGDVKLAIFDYQYTTGSGKSTQTAKLTVVAIESPDLRVPPLSLRPEHFFDRIGGMLGFQDIDFTSHPKFSKMFVVKSPSEEAVRDFFKPHLLEYFESLPGISLEADRGMMFFYRGNRTAKPDEIKSLFAQAYETYGRIVDP
jgi:hypothetical protein